MAKLVYFVLWSFKDLLKSKPLVVRFKIEYIYLNTQNALAFFH